MEENIKETKVKRINFDINKIIKSAIVYIIITAIMVGVIVGSLTLVSLIPSEWIRESIEYSAKDISEEIDVDEGKIYMNLGYKTETIFTFTDALMFNIAYSVDSSRPFYSAMANLKDGTKNENQEIRSIDEGGDKRYLINGDSTVGINQIQELLALVRGEDFPSAFEYSRYWHGYLVFLRPLLIFLNYNAIRVMQVLITIVLIGILMFMLAKYTKPLYSLIYFIGLASICIFTVAFSINELTDFIIGMLATIAILWYYDEIADHQNKFFFIVGGITAFFDLLTCPLVSLVCQVVGRLDKKILHT